MDQNNKITSDAMPVSRIPKSRNRPANRPRRSAPAAAGPAPVTMTAQEWAALTSRPGGSAAVLPAISAAMPRNPRPEESKAGDKCNVCKRTKISSSRPATVCILCRIRVCSKCKETKGIHPLEEHKADAMPPHALNGNKHEQQILSTFLEENKTELATVLETEMREMESKKWTYKSGLNADVALKGSDEICAECFANVLNDFLYRYRESVKATMPIEVKKRKDCWFGKECKTQRHNDDHAKKYNHICDKKQGK